MGWLRRLRNALRPGRLERDLDDELEFHREMRRRSLGERQEATPLEVEAETSRRMGNTAFWKEEMRDARVLPWLASSLQDLRHGFTLLRRDAGVSLLIVLVLAMGIGGNAAIFTLLKSAFLDPLPFHESHRLMVHFTRR